MSAKFSIRGSQSVPIYALPYITPSAFYSRLKTHLFHKSSSSSSIYSQNTTDYETVQYKQWKEIIEPEKLTPLRNIEKSVFSTECLKALRVNRFRHFVPYVKYFTKGGPNIDIRMFFEQFIFMYSGMCTL